MTYPMPEIPQSDLTNKQLLIVTLTKTTFTLLVLMLNPKFAWTFTIYFKGDSSVHSPQH